MPAALIAYKGLQVVSPTPSGVGGQALNDNFTAIADKLFGQSGMSSVLSRSLSTPPVSPTNGDMYIVGPSPTGAWSGNANAIAVRYNGSWEFIVPAMGYHAKVVDPSADLVWFDGTAWVAYVFDNPNGVVAFSARIMFGDSSPALLVSLPAGLTIVEARVDVETPFNGIGAQVSVGTTASPGGVFPGTSADLSTAYSFSVSANIDGPVSVRVFITPGTSASAGQATVSVLARPGAV